MFLPKRRSPAICLLATGILAEDFPLTYYSRQLLFSDRARESWVEPDLKQFLKDVF
jgi:hypothetical protein